MRTSMTAVQSLLLAVVSFLFVRLSQPLLVSDPLSSRADVVRARQARVRRADTGTTDTCANVNAPLKVTASGGSSLEVGFISACLCDAAIPNFIKTNFVAEVAVELVGVSQTEDALEDLVSMRPS